jgi:hypothetical protein
MKNLLRRRSLLAVLLFGACTLYGGTALAQERACLQLDGAAAQKDWAKSPWRNVYYTLKISGQRFELNRPRHPSDRWGEKAAARIAGTVTRLDGCAVQMDGQYVWSENATLIGKPFSITGERRGPNAMGITVVGAARVPVRMVMTRAPLPPASKPPGGIQ